MKYRKLRIAWSVAWGLLSALLVVLNVWSCWWWDRVYLPGTRLGVQINSDAGRIVLITAPREPTVQTIVLGHLPSPGPGDIFYENDVLGFYLKRKPASLRLDIPYWFMFLVATAIATSPWLRCWSMRFSLRTLLIGMTVVAVALGMILALSR
jgi:hypothetical protein